MEFAINWYILSVKKNNNKKKELKKIIILRIRWEAKRMYVRKVLYDWIAHFPSPFLKLTIHNKKMLARNLYSVHFFFFDSVKLFLKIIKRFKTTNVVDFKYK